MLRLTALAASAALVAANYNRWGGKHASNSKGWEASKGWEHSSKGWNSADSWGKRWHAQSLPTASVALYDNAKCSWTPDAFVQAPPGTCTRLPGSSKYFMIDCGAESKAYYEHQAARPAGWFVRKDGDSDYAPSAGSWGAAESWAPAEAAGTADYFVCEDKECLKCEKVTVEQKKCFTSAEEKSWWGARRMEEAAEGEGEGRPQFAEGHEQQPRPEERQSEASWEPREEGNGVWYFAGHPEQQESWSPSQWSAPSHEGWAAPSWEQRNSHGSWGQNKWSAPSKGWEQRGWEQRGWDNKGWDNKGWDNKGWEQERSWGKSKTSIIVVCPTVPKGWNA